MQLPPPIAALGPLHAVNGSKLTWGLAAIVVNLGSRFLLGELTPLQVHLLRSQVVKRAVLVCIFFLPTRDLLLSVCLAFVTTLMLEFFFNERSAYCLIPKSLLRALPVAHRAPMMMTHAHVGPAANPVPNPAPAGAGAEGREGFDGSSGSSKRDDGAMDLALTALTAL